MGRLINIAGKKFGMLTVIEKAGLNKRLCALWLCICECGTTKVAMGVHLIKGEVKSCGCASSELKAIFHKTHGQAGYGNNRSSEYSTWDAMIQRCTNPNSQSYPDYGGRGIKIYESWLNSFEAFFEYMGKKPSPIHTIDRFPDKNGNYEPGNVRWATPKQQSRNHRRNKWVEYEGEKMVVQDWANKYGVDSRRLAEQLKTKSLMDSISFLLNPNRRKGRGSGAIRKIGKYSGGKLIKEYDKIKDAATDNYNVDSLYHALSKNRSYKGFDWKYLDEKVA